MPKFGTKNLLLGYSWSWIFKNYCLLWYFEISTFKFIKNESLTHTVNFGIRSTFFKGLGPGPGPLHKVHQIQVRIEPGRKLFTIIKKKINLLRQFPIISEYKPNLSKYRIYSKERLCSKERLPRISAPLFSQKGRSFEK